MTDRTGDPLNDVPARDPGEHCNGRRSDNGRFVGYCQQPAGWGTDTGSGRCKLHGGATPSGPDHGRYDHGLYSEVLREEDQAVLDALEDLSTAKKLEDTLNLQIVKLRRAVDSLEGSQRQSFWDAFEELVANVDDPSTGDLRALARMLGQNERAIRDWANLIRKTAKTLHDITEGQALNVSHDVDEDALSELRDLAEDVYQ